MIEKIKVFIWALIYFPVYRYRCLKTSKYRKEFGVLKSEETIRLIVSSRCSVCRYGDGEIKQMYHYTQSGSIDTYSGDPFCNYNAVLASRLIEVYTSAIPNLLLCVPYGLKDSLGWNLKTRTYWEREWLARYRILNEWNLKRTFGDASFVRFYMNRKDIKDYPSYIALLQKIWDNREVVIVEGNHSCLGIGNQLFGNATTIQRILCPATDAFEKYDQILDATKQLVSKDRLILAALGPTATVLAYDLHQCGYQAIDIGHIDIEYEWYLMKATQKVAVSNKYVDEVREGRINTKCNDDLYKSQIICRIE